MLIAQALGEYAALSAFIEGFSEVSVRVEDTLGEWGMEGLAVLVAAGLIWRLFVAIRR